MVTKQPCPKCRDEGRDSKGDNLWIYPDGKAFCHAGHGKITAEKTTVESKLSVSDCMDNPPGHDPARGISEEVLSQYDIRCEHDVHSGKIKRIYYPYKDEFGAISGIKIRTIPKGFLVAGKLNGVFGKHLAVKATKSALFITEGEEDALALKEIFRPEIKKDSPVVSLPNGASMGDVDAILKADQEFFLKFKRIYLCFDNDIPGQNTAKKLGEWLISLGVEVYIVRNSSPGALKDASDYLVSGKGKEYYDCISKTQRYKPEGIIHGSEISVSDLLASIPEGYQTPFPELNDKLHGVRKGEIITVCAGSGIGKSTLVREIGYDLVVRHGLTVCHIALEDRVQTTAASYIAMDNNVPTPRFRSDPSILPTSQIEASMDRTVRKMYFFNHFGSIDTAEFKSKLMYYARSGVDFIILDHLSMVISGSDISNERKEIDKIMTDLASMVVNTGVGLINVVHLKRRETRESGKSLNEGGGVSLTDLRGSAALEQLSWSVLAMERDQQAQDGSEDYAFLRVLKNRTWGFTGRAGRVKYVHSTGRLVHAPEDIEGGSTHDIDKELPEAVPEVTPEEESSSEILKELSKIFGHD